MARRLAGAARGGASAGAQIGAHGIWMEFPSRAEIHMVLSVHVAVERGSFVSLIGLEQASGGAQG